MNDKIVKNVASGVSKFLTEKAFETIGRKPYSLIVDETIDISNKNNFLIMYLSDNYEYEYELISLCRMEKASLEEVYKSLKN